MLRLGLRLFLLGSLGVALILEETLGQPEWDWRNRWPSRGGGWRRPAASSEEIMTGSIINEIQTEDPHAIEGGSRWENTGRSFRRGEVIPDWTAHGERPMWNLFGNGFGFRNRGPHSVDDGFWPIRPHPTIPQHTPRWTYWGANKANSGGDDNVGGRFLNLFPSRTTSIKDVKLKQSGIKKEGKWITGVQKVGGQRYYNYSYVKDSINITNMREDFAANTTVWRRKKRNIPLTKLPAGPFNENN